MSRAGSIKRDGKTWYFVVDIAQRRRATAPGPQARLRDQGRGTRRADRGARRAAAREVRSTASRHRRRVPRRLARRAHDGRSAAEHDRRLPRRRATPREARRRRPVPAGPPTARPRPALRRPARREALRTTPVTPDCPLHPHRHRQGAARRGPHRARAAQRGAARHSPVGRVGALTRDDRVDSRGAARVPRLLPRHRPRSDPARRRDDRAATQRAVRPPLAGRRPRRPQARRPPGDHDRRPRAGRRRHEDLAVAPHRRPRPDDRRVAPRAPEASARGPADVRTGLDRLRASCSRCATVAAGIPT